MDSNPLQACNNDSKILSCHRWCIRTVVYCSSHWNLHPRKKMLCSINWVAKNVKTLSFRWSCFQIYSKVHVSIRRLLNVLLRSVYLYKLDKFGIYMNVVHVNENCWKEEHTISAYFQYISCFSKWCDFDYSLSIGQIYFLFKQAMFWILLIYFQKLLV